MGTTVSSISSRSDGEICDRARSRRAFERRSADLLGSGSLSLVAVVGDAAGGRGVRTASAAVSVPSTVAGSLHLEED